jgi:hypothetical protein
MALKWKRMAGLLVYFEVYPYGERVRDGYGYGLVEMGAVYTLRQKFL